MKTLSQRIVFARIVVALTASVLAGPTHAWDPIRDLTGKNLSNHIDDAFDRTRNSVEKFFHNPVEYILSRPERLFSEVCALPAQVMNYDFEGQVGRGHQLYSLPWELIRDVQQFYSTNLANVRFAVNVRTFNGNAVTVGNTIYFPRVIDLSNRGDLYWMLHELEHTVQYQHRPRAAKLCEYTLKAISHLSTTNHDWEHAADRKAGFVLEQLDWMYGFRVGW